VTSKGQKAVVDAEKITERIRQESLLS